MPAATIDIDRILTAAVLTGSRISGLMVFAPFLGSVSIPMQVKAGLVCLLTFLLYPLCGVPRMHLSGLAWGTVMLSELLIGLLLGLVLQFIFEAVQLAGHMLGVQMGFSLVNVLDPQTQVDTPVLAIFNQLVALLIFLQLDVHHWIVRAIVRSFAYLPPPVTDISFALSESLLRAAAGIWITGLQIAAPALLATMMTDIVLGFVGKASPQLPVLFVGLSLKTLLGLVVVIAGLALWPQKLEHHFLHAIEQGEQLLHLAR
ncbi:MAG TPA: flagellar biosynthetic protein FliR [Terriglobales bacterium]|nr:flagellar biosynthetic protein FliR [Terriglobales bacterium]